MNVTTWVIRTLCCAEEVSKRCTYERFHSYEMYQRQRKPSATQSSSVVVWGWREDLEWYNGLVRVMICCVFIIVVVT
jgi:hypothetical protein